EKPKLFHSNSNTNTITKNKSNKTQENKQPQAVTLECDDDDDIAVSENKMESDELLDVSIYVSNFGLDNNNNDNKLSAEDEDLFNEFTEYECDRLNEAFENK